MALFDTITNGQSRKGIAEARRTGWAYILDRTTSVDVRASHRGEMNGAMKQPLVLMPVTLALVVAPCTRVMQRSVDLPHTEGVPYARQNISCG